MAYRYHSEMPPKPEDHLITFAVRNGATLKAKFRCYYMRRKPVHDPHWHDHVNWPAPNYHPGPICQMKLPRDKNPKIPFPALVRFEDLEEIHLADEGYTEAFVTYEDEAAEAFFDTEAWIDNDQDNVVHIRVNTFFPSFSDKPIDVRFTVFVAKGDTVDAVSHGMITVLPGKASKRAKMEAASDEQDQVRTQDELNETATDESSTDGE